MNGTARYRYESALGFAILLLQIDFRSQGDSHKVWLRILCKDVECFIGLLLCG